MLGCWVLGTVSTVDAPSPPPPSPSPPPFPPGYVSAFISNHDGGCPLSFYHGMSCFDSPNYPNTFSSYVTSRSCHLHLGGVAQTLHVVDFDLPDDASLFRIYSGYHVDWTSGNTSTYSGNTSTGPSGVVVSAGTYIKFSGGAYRGEGHSGFRICAGVTPSYVLHCTQAHNSSAS